MLEQRASDRQMSMMMMQKMIHHLKSNSTMMRNMCRIKTGDNNMHSSMKHLMGSAMMKHEQMLQDMRKCIEMRETRHDKPH